MNNLSFITIRDSLHLSNYDESRCVFSNGDGKYYLINEKTKQLINRLKSSESWEEAYTHFLNDEDQDLTVDEFIDFIYSILHLNNDMTSSFTGKSYLRLRLTVIKKEFAGALADMISFLFHKNFFPYAFGLLLVVNISFILFTAGQLSISNEGWSYLIVFGIYFISIILHEAGHISACRKFGAHHGGIGVGFYLVFPVFWADVTGLWMLRRKERVITNLAGIHTQLFINTLVIALYLVTGKPYFLLGADVIALSSIFQLWPFMRYDGYWILSDTLEAPNLMKVSAREIKDLLFELIGIKGKGIRNRKDWYLIIYAFSNAFLTILYILYVVINHGEIVVHYPTFTWQLVTDLINGHFVSSDLFVNYLIVTLFYYIVVKKSFDLAYKQIRQNKIHLFRLNSLKV